jgi:hypothetical protein
MECAVDCDELLVEILNLAAEVSRRFIQYNNPKYQLPLTGRNSRAGHVQQLDEKQKRLRRLMNDYNNQNCPKPLPAPVLELATRPTPQLTPSPNTLPPPPVPRIGENQSPDWSARPPTPGETARAGTVMTVIIVIMGIIYVFVFS